MRKFLFACLLVPMLAACTTTQTQQATATTGRVVTAGQLFCAKATTNGPLVVALADAAGAPVNVTGLASSVVADACAAINAIPVSPPANPAAAPVVSAAVVLAAQ